MRPPHLRAPLRSLAAFASIAFAFAVAFAHAQQPMGTIATHDANVSGSLQVHDELASLLSNASITAHDRTAVIALTRGGEVLVCATSEFHLLHAGTGNALLFGLDRGAFELYTTSNANDILLTPDIRFTLEPTSAATQQYDLRLSVTRNGDTCVDNAGLTSPVLLLNDAFSSASYRLMPGQHVLFEHGSLREVVDHERTSCGCPPPTPTPTQLAANATPAQQIAAQHPFPEAESAGLTPTAAAPRPLGAAQAPAAITYNAPTGTILTPEPPPLITTDPTAPPPTPPGLHAIAHSIGHFFRKIFHGSTNP